jgi:hypothetical protein
MSENKIILKVLLTLLAVSRHNTRKICQMLYVQYILMISKSVLETYRVY